VEAARDVRYLKANGVTMIARPKETEDNPCPP
jgi:hypothetical protein